MLAISIKLNLLLHFWEVFYRHEQTRLNADVVTVKFGAINIFNGLGVNWGIINTKERFINISKLRKEKVDKIYFCIKFR